MRRWVAAGLVAVLASCGSDDEPTLADPEETTSTSEATATSVPGSTCPEAVPPFSATWVPDGWSADLQPGSGGTEQHECDVWHWGPADGARGSMVDVWVGDGAEALTPERSRSIMVLGRPAQIGPIHEGFLVQLDGHALKGYGIEEEILERMAVGLYPHGPPVAPEATEDPLPDGLHAARLLAVDEGRDGCELCQRVITFERLRELFTGPAPEPPQGNLRHSPFWITVHDGEVTRIDEQYVP